MWDEGNWVMAYILEHLAVSLAMEPHDSYKLLYQGVRGSVHIITFPAALTERLAEEGDELDLIDGGPLWECIRPVGSLLHLSLRQFKAAGTHLEELSVA